MEATAVADNRARQDRRADPARLGPRERAERTQARARQFPAAVVEEALEAEVRGAVVEERAAAEAEEEPAVEEDL